MNLFGSNKKPLPGERKQVFPQGVPGVTQGVPPDLLPGGQQANAQAAPPPAAQPAPQPVKRRRVAAKKKVPPAPGADRDPGHRSRRLPTAFGRRRRVPPRRPQMAFGRPLPGERNGADRRERCRIVAYLFSAANRFPLRLKTL